MKIIIKNEYRPIYTFSGVAGEGLRASPRDPTTLNYKLRVLKK